MMAALPRPPDALLLDFDGVVLASVSIKVQAYLTIYEKEDPAKLAQVLAYQRLHGGVTRRLMFRHFETQLFGRAGDVEAVERLSAAYTRLVHDAVLTCPFVPGARRFLEIAYGRADLHVVSATPQEELVDIVRRRGLSVYFKGVHGAPATKPEVFGRILADNRYVPDRTLAVGDSTTEYFAAAALGIPFLGVVPPGTSNPFVRHVPTVPSLETLDALLGFD